jgi:hypothetical protein
MSWDGETLSSNDAARFLRVVGRPRASEIMIDDGHGIAKTDAYNLRDAVFELEVHYGGAEWRKNRNLPEIKWGFRFLDEENRKIMIINENSLKVKKSEKNEKAVTKVEKQREEFLDSDDKFPSYRNSNTFLRASRYRKRW